MNFKIGIDAAGCIFYIANSDIKYDYTLKLRDLPELFKIKNNFKMNFNEKFLQFHLNVLISPEIFTISPEK